MPFICIRFLGLPKEILPRIGSPREGLPRAVSPREARPEKVNLGVTIHGSKRIMFVPRAGAPRSGVPREACPRQTPQGNSYMNMDTNFTIFFSFAFSYIDRTYADGNNEVFAATLFSWRQRNFCGCAALKTAVYVAAESLRLEAMSFLLLVGNLAAAAFF